MPREQMRIQIRLFAMLRERVGESSLELGLPAGATVEDALTALAADERLGGLLGRLPVRMAVNRDYAAPETVLHGGDELALIPPVSGGAEGDPFAGAGAGVDPNAGGAQAVGVVHVRVCAELLSLDRLLAAVADPGAGAVVVFQGVTREVERLEYEAYVEMARERIERILLDCIRRHGLRAAAAEHRVGDVPRGEPSVIVAVSSAHRDAAFAGAREAIDRIKAEAPIWKREHGEGGPAQWLAGTPAPTGTVADPAATATAPAESG